MEASTVVNNGGARAIAMDTSTAKSAAVEASTSKATNRQNRRRHGHRRHHRAPVPWPARPGQRLQQPTMRTFSFVTLPFSV